MSRLDTLKEEIVRAISAREFHNQLDFPDWDGLQNTLVQCPRGDSHQDGEDSTPSLAIDPANGAFYCAGCGWRGTSIVGYYTDVHAGGDYDKALKALYAKLIRPTISEDEVRGYYECLQRRPKLQQRITATRGWTRATQRKFRLGWCEKRKRVAIPIYNLSGLCVDLRFHDSVYAAPTKNSHRVPMLALAQRSRTGDWFPLSPAVNPFDSSKDTVWIVEGEPDAILAWQDGLNAVTVTGGASVFSGLAYELLHFLAGRHVVLCLDADEAGRKAAAKLTSRLAAVQIASLKRVEVPDGKDITDFFLKHGGSAQQLKQIAALAEYVIKPKRMESLEVPLSATSEAKYIGKQVRTAVLVNGKHHSPQAIPARLTFSCQTTNFCSRCPCKTTGTAEHFVHSDDPHLLEWLIAKRFDTNIRSDLKLPSTCKMNVTVDEWQNVERLTVIPSLSDKRSEDKSAYVTREAYFLGHSIDSNANYLATAMPVVHPLTKESVLLIEKVQGTSDSITSFALQDSEVARLKELFIGEPIQIIKDICAMLAANHTHIYQRWDLHAAIDLVFHSLRDFTFADVQLPKGSMEILVLGDTRCGKGQVAEGLVRFYDLGEVVSGENASFMGLCGGASKVGDGFQLVWGAIPLNHGRLVVVDEFTGLDTDVLGKLSRVRSEGVAELNKGGINAKTVSNARLIWIANPKKGREVASFAHGVTAVRDLIGTNEDIARFDLALVVQKGEVDIHEINRLEHARVESKFTREDLRKVVLWCWSRKPEHVLFSREATELILRSATRMSQRYSATIPLIQGENARFKLAKLAAAIAGRCFSTPDGRFLQVTEAHAKAAIGFVRYLYDKPSMAYNVYSSVEHQSGKLTNLDELNEWYKRWDVHIRRLLVDGQLSVEAFGTREMQDWCSVDQNVAKKFVGLLVRAQAVRQEGSGLYRKNPTYIRYLKKMKASMEKK